MDTAFIERALRAAGELPPGLRVARVDVRPLALQGFISDVARCRISYAAESDGHDDGGSQKMASLRPSVIVKCTASGAESYAAGVECDAYRTEATFFAVLAEVVAVSSPDCLLVVADADDARYCYVLEDLDERSGLYFVPQAEGAGEEECLAVAVGLAELHAPRWRWDAPLPAWVLPLTAHRLRNPAAAVSEYWQAFSASAYKTELPPTSQRAFERVAARAATLAAALDQGPRTLLHGDARGDGDAGAGGGPPRLAHHARRGLRHARHAAGRRRCLRDARRLPRPARERRVTRVADGETRRHTTSSSRFIKHIGVQLERFIKGH